jgi:hypothetical protein
MGETLQADELDAHCERLQYPVMRADAAAACADVTLEVGGEEMNLGVLVSELAHDSFTNAEELSTAIEASLEATGRGIGE